MRDFFFDSAWPAQPSTWSNYSISFCFPINLCEIPRPPVDFDELTRARWEGVWARGFFWPSFCLQPVVPPPQEGGSSSKALAATPAAGVCFPRIAALCARLRLLLKEKGMRWGGVNQQPLSLAKAWPGSGPRGLFSCSAHST